MTVKIRNIIIFMSAAAFLASCGRPGDTETSFIGTAQDVRSLTGNYSGNLSERDAKRYLAQVRKTLNTQLGETQEKLMIVPVRIQSVERKTISEKLNYLGNIEGYPSITIYPRLNDTMTDIYVKNGDHVKKGQLMAKISDKTVSSSYRQAKAALASAKSQLSNTNMEFKRLKSLYDNNAVSQSQWDQMVTRKETAEAGLEQAEAALEMADTRLSYSLIKAPVSGYVSNVNYEAGEMATPQMAFAQVHAISEVKLSAEITDSDLLKVKKGQKVELSISNYPKRVFTGKVDNISPVVNPQTRTADVEIVIPNKDNLLRPGMFARAAIVINEHANALVIDKYVAETETERIQEGKGLRNTKVIRNYSCFIVKDDIAVKRELTAGIESGDKIEILSGLNEGDLVVVMGQTNLSDSSMVKIIND